MRIGTSRGFTLTELAIALLIIGLLLGGLLVPLSAQHDLRTQTETEEFFSDIREALIGFAMTHSATDGKPYLPCPDTNNDGEEDRAASPGACSSDEGRLPWATLGLAATDAWGNRIRYRVDSGFSNSASGFLLTTNGTLEICASSGGTCTGTDLVANSLPAVFLSHGKNGHGAFNSSGSTNTASTIVDEQENTNGDKKFLSKSWVEGDYDDLTSWLPPGILFNRMVAAGKLP